jgi:hypothetical protein
MLASSIAMTKNTVPPNSDYLAKTYLASTPDHVNHASTLEIPDHVRK